MLDHKGTKTIKTKRLLLRKFTLEDKHNMFNNWASDDKVTEHLSWPTHKNISISEMFIKHVLKKYNQKNEYIWAIYNNDCEMVIGSIGVVKINEREEACEIGYCIGSEYWGRGLTTEALKSVLKYLFMEVGFERIEALHSTKNPASGRVLVKSGFKHEGTLRHYKKSNEGKFVDCEIYGVIREDYNIKL